MLLSFSLSKSLKQESLRRNPLIKGTLQRLSMLGLSLGYARFIGKNRSKYVRFIGKSMSGLSVKRPPSMSGLSSWTHGPYGPDIVSERKNTDCIHFPNYVRFIVMDNWPVGRVGPVSSWAISGPGDGGAETMSGLSAWTSVPVTICPQGRYGTATSAWAEMDGPVSKSWTVSPPAQVCPVYRGCTTDRSGQVEAIRFRARGHDLRSMSGVT